MSSASTAQKTTDHDFIRHWVEQRRGRPARVRQTAPGKPKARKGSEGILRIDFDPPDEALEKISWDDFFEKFEDADLAFLYQDKTAGGKPSRFHKFVSRDSVDADEEEDEDEEEELDDEDEEDDEGDDAGEDDDDDDDDDDKD